MKKKDKFDKTKDFNKEIKPLLDELILKCSLNNMPFFFSACIKNDEDGSTYISDATTTGSRNIELTDDKIIKYISVLNGFDTVPKRQEIEIDMDDLDF